MQVINKKRDFLTLFDVSAAEIGALLERASWYKLHRTKVNILEGRVLGLIFEKKSTRTRVSFEVAISRLGGSAIYLGRDVTQLSRGESYADTARVLSRYVDILVLRTFAHQDLVELAGAASIPVINGLTDQFHPCQLLADLLTLKEKKGDLGLLKISYIGDGNNMAASWVNAAILLDLQLTVACPSGFGPAKEVVNRAKKSPKISFTNNVKLAIKDCDAVNTDTWFSMGQKISKKKQQAFKGFQINNKLLADAKKNVVVLHCLPAHRGEEITDQVLDGPHSVVFDQAENRLYVQMALMEMLLKK